MPTSSPSHISLIYYLETEGDNEFMKFVVLLRFWQVNDDPDACSKNKGLLSFLHTLRHSG